MQAAVFIDGGTPKVLGTAQASAQPGLSDDSGSFDGSKSASGTDAKWYIGINLPAGVIITELRAYMRGAYGSGEVAAVYLQRKAYNSATWSDLANISQGPNSEADVSTTLSHTVDGSYAYRLYVYIDHPSSGGGSYDGFVRGVRLAYTVSQPLP